MTERGARASSIGGRVKASGYQRRGPYHVGRSRRYRRRETYVVETVGLPEPALHGELVVLLVGTSSVRGLFP